MGFRIGRKYGSHSYPISRGLGVGPGGGPISGKILVPNILAVYNIPDAPLQDQSEAQPATIDQTYELDKSSTELADGINTVNTISSGALTPSGPAPFPGRWLRVLSNTPRWIDQQPWFFDPVAGNDENNGATAGTALLTVAEWCRRVRTLKMSPSAPFYTLNLLNDIAENDVFRPTAEVGEDFAGSNVFPALVLGQRTTLLAGTLGATSNITNTTTSVQALFDGGAGFVPANFLGRQVVVSDTTRVTAVANNVSGLIRLTVTSSAMLLTNFLVTISGSAFPSANGSFQVTVIDPTHVDLQGSTFVSSGADAATLTVEIVAGAITADTGFVGLATVSEWVNVNPSAMPTPTVTRLTFANLAKFIADLAPYTVVSLTKFGPDIVSIGTPNERFRFLYVNPPLSNADESLTFKSNAFSFILCRIQRRPAFVGANGTFFACDMDFSTQIAPASNGAILPQATINVLDTTGFPGSGQIAVNIAGVGPSTINYTGKTATAFTGCTGGAGTLLTNNVVDNLIPTDVSVGAGSVFTLSSCGLRRTAIEPMESGIASFIDVHIEYGFVRTRTGTATPAFGGAFAAATLAMGALVDIRGTVGIGVFNSPPLTAGVSIQRNGKLQVISSDPHGFYGNGNGTVGLEAIEGATVGIKTTVTPTITGAVGDINMDSPKDLVGTALADVSGAVGVLKGADEYGGANLVQLQVAVAKGWVNNVLVRVAGVGGTVEANGGWTAKVAAPTQINLQGSTFATPWTAGGEISWDIGLPLTSWSTGAGSYTDAATFNRNAVNPRTGTSIIAFA